MNLKIYLRLFIMGWPENGKMSGDNLNDYLLHIFVLIYGGWELILYRKNNNTSINKALETSESNKQLV